MTLTTTDLQEWANHPATQKFLNELRESRQETLENWAAEVYIGESADQSALMNAKALGGVHVLNQLITKIDEMKAEEHDS